jgi:hypothetical protein
MVLTPLPLQYAVRRGLAAAAAALPASARAAFATGSPAGDALDGPMLMRDFIHQSLYHPVRLRRRSRHSTASHGSLAPAPQWGPPNRAHALSASPPHPGAARPTHCAARPLRSWATSTARARPWRACRSLSSLAPSSARRSTA